MIKEKTIELITATLTELLKKEGDLKEGQSAKITIEIVSAPLVTVQVKTNESDEAVLNRVIAKMRRHGMRMGNALAYSNTTLAHVKQWDTRDSVFKLRNVGIKAATEFAEALQEEGIECQWVNLFLSPNLNSAGSLAREIQTGVVRDISENNWTEMVEAVFSPPKQHSKTQQHVINELRIAKNDQVSASQAFPRKIRANRWGSLIFLINMRWKNKGLPFRIRFIHEPSLQNKHNGKLHVVVIQ